ncbi:ABC transporter substrate-binding protein [Allofustis seminis]|uniref:ABC transporter substrate-binding protein n=1 Tax=Allofustis seminis TaxID=166939 RepID=UPI00037C51EE|nr:ABC transporter substrate-binding protein [Allofustis seminis]
MHKNWKKVISSLFTLMLAILLVACGNKNDKKEGDGPVELEFFYPVNVGGPATKVIDQIVADFEAENPDIKVNPVYTGNYDDTFTKIQTAVQGGTPPDLFISLATHRFTMEDLGIVEPLDHFIEADKDGKEYIEDFLPSFMEDSYVDGKTISIPFQRSTMVLYYNKDLFKEAGLDPEQPPTSWDELIEYSKKLTNDDHFGVGLALNSGSAQWSFGGFSLQNSKDGGNLMSDDGKKVFFDTPENIEALQLWIDLQNKYEVMNKGIVQWTDLPTQFLAQEVAMIYHTTGNMGNINENAEFEFGTAFLPGNKRMAAPTGGGNFYISKDISDQHKEAAWKFIRFATSTEQLTNWSLNTGYIPPRQSSIDSDEMQKYYSEIPQARVAYEQLEVAKPELTTYDAAQVWRILNDSIQSAITGEKTAAEALKEAQANADAVLERYQGE